MRLRHLARVSASLVLLAVMIVLGAVPQASAGTITATFKGTVQAAVDSTGVFGTPGANLAGAAYTLVFTVDPALGDYSTFNGTITDPLLSGDQIFGGKNAALTINGHHYSFIGGSSAAGNFDIAGSKPGFANLAYQVNNTTPLSQVKAFLVSTNPGPNFPASVLTAATITSCPAGSCTFVGGFVIPAASTAGLSFKAA